MILLHGFLVTSDLNWVASGVSDRLAGAGYQVVRLDARGHGESAKPLDPSAYSASRLNADVLELADRVGAERFALVGYSMGADTAARIAAAVPQRVAALVLGGVGGSLADPPDLDRRAVAASLRGGPRPDGPSTEPDFAGLADALGADRDAAAALFEGLGRLPDPDYGVTTCEVLVISGSEDTMGGGDAADLAARYRRGRAVSLQGLDHLGAVFDASFADSVVGFLAEVYPANTPR